LFLTRGVSSRILGIRIRCYTIRRSHAQMAFHLVPQIVPASIEQAHRACSFAFIIASVVVTIFPQRSQAAGSLPSARIIL
jgi:hypothetical protein